MNYEEAIIIGKRRRSDAACALSRYLSERVAELCPVRPTKGSVVDACAFDPVGVESFRELCITAGTDGQRQALVLLVDAEGFAKACTQKTYPLPIAVQLALAIPLPVFAGRDGVLLGELVSRAARRVQADVRHPETPAGPPTAAPGVREVQGRALAMPQAA